MRSNGERDSRHCGGEGSLQEIRREYKRSEKKNQKVAWKEAQAKTAECREREKERKEKRSALQKPASVWFPRRPPAAAWQRLNDLPNNKSSRRYDRTPPERPKPGNELPAGLLTPAREETSIFPFLYSFSRYLFHCSSASMTFRLCASSSQTGSTYKTLRTIFCNFCTYTK